MQLQEGVHQPQVNYEPELLTKDEAMAYMKIKSGLLYKFINMEKDPLPVIWIGSVMWFEKSDIIEFLRKHKQNTAERLAAALQARKKNKES